MDRATAPATSWSVRGSPLDLRSPLAAGIVNVTSDSFFEGARSTTPERAVADGLALIAAGFDIVDIGAVAARSGPPVPAEEEAAKLVPAIAGLAAATEAPISADTFSPSVARAAIQAGAAIVNDISGSHDPEMLEVCAETGAGLVVMHIEGPPRTDRPPPTYTDVIARMLEFFAERIAEAESRGLAAEQIALDPGLDFDLSLADDIEVMARLEELHVLERPLFVALSRKDFLGAILAGSWEQRLPAGEREWATAAATALAVAAGAQVIRIHDSSALQALRVAHRISVG